MVNFSVCNKIKVIYLFDCIILHKQQSGKKVMSEPDTCIVNVQNISLYVTNTHTRCHSCIISRMSCLIFSSVIKSLLGMPYDSFWDESEIDHINAFRHIVLQFCNIFLIIYYPDIDLTCMVFFLPRSYAWFFFKWTGPAWFFFLKLPHFHQILVGPPPGLKK